MRYIFGPVASRRFGISLGIDPFVDKKICNFDCLYCELDRSDFQNLHTQFANPNPEDILSELEEFLRKNSNTLDVITISGNGEPTLYKRLDELVVGVNRLKRDGVKSLILSNSSKVGDSGVVDALLKFDIVKLSLDAITQEVFKKIDRPDSSIDIESLKSSILEFAKKFKGELILEILFLEGINDCESEIYGFLEFIKELLPSRVDIGTISRPPAYRVEALSEERLELIADVLKDGAPILIAKSKKESSLSLNYEELLETIKRRPISVGELELISSKESVNRAKKSPSVETLRYGNLEFLKCR